MAEPDAFGVTTALRASGILQDFNAAGVIGVSDVHIARTLGRIGREQDEFVLLAVALTVTALRTGSVCLDLSSAKAQFSSAIDPNSTVVLDWPEPREWARRVAASSLASGDRGADSRPLVVIDLLVYLQRYFLQEQTIARFVDSAALRPAPSLDADRLAAATNRLFPPSSTSSDEPDLQKLAAVVAVHRWFSIVAGGPGTGKTTTVAKLIAILQDQAQGSLRVALCAPTGKAAVRLAEAAVGAVSTFPKEDQARVGLLNASTIHRLLSTIPGVSTRFRFNRENRLPHNVVVVDESSMIPVTLMARLIEALRDDARLILVGDPDQLASVEAGAVLGDLVERPAMTDVQLPQSIEIFAPTELASMPEDARSSALLSGIVRLDKNHRFPLDIQTLARAAQVGDADLVMSILRVGSSHIEFVEGDLGDKINLNGVRSDVLKANKTLRDASNAGDKPSILAALNRHRVLCAHLEGPYGATEWNRKIEAWLAHAIDGYGRDRPWYLGRPVLITTNDYQLKLFNGDTGVVVDESGSRGVLFQREGELVVVPPSRLPDVRTVHAMSIHRSQGSEYPEVTVIVPPADSPLATRELFYTAVTRTSNRLRVVGSDEAIRKSVNTPIRRASGLRHRRASRDPINPNHDGVG